MGNFGHGIVRSTIGEVCRRAGKDGLVYEFMFEEMQGCDAIDIECMLSSSEDRLE